MHKTYDIDIEMIGRVSNVVATNIIVAAVEKQTGRQVADIKVRYNGDKFDGFDIIFDPKLKVHHNVVKSTKEFIETHFDEN